MECIGAISASEQKRAASGAGLYQESVTAPIQKDNNDDEGPCEDEIELTISSDISVYEMSPVEKVRSIFLNPYSLIFTESSTSAAKYCACSAFKPTATQGMA